MKQTRKKRILIVDDSEMNREILSGMLENEYDIVEAEDGKKAIAIMEEGRYSFSIVLLDITMPELDGIGALKKIKEADSNALVIMCSAMGQQAMVIESIQAGAKDFIVKPFQADRGVGDSLPEQVV